MSADRELLKSAAKAAGLLFIDDRETGLTIQRPDGDDIYNYHWNPLIDDGDALRLAVKLGIEIIPDIEVATTTTAFMCGRNGLNTFEEWAPMRDGSQDDPDAATRRAIVRAAAAIGRAMP